MGKPDGGHVRDASRGRRERAKRSSNVVSGKGDGCAVIGIALITGFVSIPLLAGGGLLYYFFA